MAKAITSIHRIELSEEEKRKRDLLEIEQLIADNKDVIKELLYVLTKMNNRGVLEGVGSLFGQGDRVLDILVKAADKPETANTIKNLLLMIGTLGTLNVQQIEPLILKVNNGIARVAKAEQKAGRASYLSIFRSLGDPEILQAVLFLLTFLKGIGENKKELERTTQPPEEQVMPVEQKEGILMQSGDAGRNEKGETGIRRGWLLAAAGFSLLGLTLSKK
ncbi:hypothetical protein BTO28_15505 [Domibacillus epiphyticus]|uniref:DUF1641 domain-containing protein n=1 Tax=Domibacillus epiphyticus TaxID=1714355 RepID=A0A1V2A446_9BACI|nr:hypothetical protein BTO28_15505 [Domibacillus epiphyticus]